MASIRVINKAITLFCLTGLGLSIYAYIVELNIQQNEDYEALCDINEHINCSKVFASPYGRGFGIIGRIFGENSPLNKPNSIAGIFFYSLLGTLAQSSSLFITRISYLLIISSNLLTIYLAYILYFVLHDLCLICVSLYAVNFINLLLSSYKLTNIKANMGKKRA